jgi:hypothetical protein
VIVETVPVVRIPAPQWVVWRCPKCNRILARLLLTAGSAVEIKCSICNTLATREAA